MIMKLAYIANFSRAVKAKFIAFKSDLIAFDESFDDPYITDIFDAKLEDAEDIILPRSKQDQNEADTDIRNKYMDNLVPILKELRYRVKKGIQSGDIVVGLASFGIGPFLRSITQHSIGEFHLAYGVCFAQVTLFHTVLAELGFDAAKVTSIKTNHDLAWGMEDTKITLAEEITELSEGNAAIVQRCLDEDQNVIDGLRAMAEASGNVNLKKEATVNAILRSLNYMPVRKPYNRSIKPGASIVLHTEFVAKNILQLTLLTDVKVVIGLCALKSDVVMLGTELPFNEEWEGKKKDLLGSGRFIKLTNCDTHKKAKVRCYYVNV